MHADFGSGRWDGAPIGIPYVTVARGAAAGVRSLRLRRRVRPRPLSDPARRARGGRPRIRRRPPCDRGGPLALPALRAVRRLPGGRREPLARRLRGDLEPAVEPAAPARAGPRPTPPACRSCPGSRATTRCAAAAIDHALRFTAPRTRSAFVYPARHFASSLTDPALPAMGQRFRLKRGFDVSRFPRQARVVLRALKRYGMILADNGSPWYVSGAPEPRLGQRRPALPPRRARAAPSRPWTRALCRARDAE